MNGKRLGRNASRIETHLDVAALAATWVRRNSEQIAVRVNCDTDSGVKGISYEPRARQSGPSDPVGARVCAPPDQVAITARIMLAQLELAERLSAQARVALSRAERAGRSLLAMDAESARALTSQDELANDDDDQTLSAQCANVACRRVVARTANDRLREGRCQACWRYRKRNGAERPRNLCLLDLDEERVIVEEPVVTKW